MVREIFRYRKCEHRPKGEQPRDDSGPARTQAGTGEGAGAVSAIEGRWESVIGGVFDQISPAAQSVPPRVGKHP